MTGLKEQFELSPLQTEIRSFTVATGTPTALATGTSEYAYANMWYAQAPATNSGDVFLSVEDDGEPKLTLNAGDYTPWIPKTWLGSHFVYGDTAGDVLILYLRR